MWGASVKARINVCEVGEHISIQIKHRMDRLVICEIICTHSLVLCAVLCLSECDSVRQMDACPEEKSSEGRVSEIDVCCLSISLYRYVRVFVCRSPWMRRRVRLLFAVFCGPVNEATFNAGRAAHIYRHSAHKTSVLSNYNSQAILAAGLSIWEAILLGECEPPEHSAQPSLGHLLMTHTHTHTHRERERER